MEQRSVALKIAGQSLRLKTDQPDEVLSSVVAMIEERVDRVRGRSKSPPTMKMMIMVAMMLATELQEAQVSNDDTKLAMERHANAALDLLQRIEI